MKSSFIFRFLGIGLISAFYIGCMEDPLHADLSDGELDLAVKELYGIDGVTYQIPPSIGNKTRLHLGTDEGFNYKALLFKSSFISNESFYWTLSSFLDSTVHIDSAFFTINVHRDTLETPTTFELYYFPDNALDSIFSEAESNYLNFTDTEIAAASFVSNGTEESYAVDTITTQYRVRFPAEELFDSTFADTSLNYSLLLTLPNGDDELHTFYSREYDYTNVLTPKLEIYFRLFTYPDSADTSQDVNIDTLSRSFYVSQDLSLLVPPELTEQDTAFVSIGRGKGLRSVISMDFLDTLQLPNQTSFDKAELTFHIVPDTNIASFSIWAAPLTDTVSLSSFKTFEEDDFSVEGSMYSSGSVLNNKVVFNIRNFLQNQNFENVDNLGLKLYANINNNLQTDVHFYSADHDSLYPKLFIQYVAP
jgi:hypothetical protein